MFVLCLCYVFLTPEIENLSPRHIDRTSSSRLRAAFNRCAIRSRSLGPRSTCRSELHPGMRNWVFASPAGPRSLGPGSTCRSELYCQQHIYLYKPHIYQCRGTTCRLHIFTTMLVVENKRVIFLYGESVSKGPRLFRWVWLFRIWIGIWICIGI